MTQEANDTSADAHQATERIEEARQLVRSTSQSLKAILGDLESGNVKDLSLSPKLVTQLTTALTDLQKREAEFDARFKSQLPDGDIDFDRLRHDIGCRLARIRQCCRENDVPEGTAGP